MGSIKGIKALKAAGKRKVSRIHIEKADNGIKVHHRMEPQTQRHPGGGMSMIHDDGQENVFNKPAQAKKHVAGLMANMMDSDDADQGAPPEAM